MGQPNSAGFVNQLTEELHVKTGWKIPRKFSDENLLTQFERAYFLKKAKQIQESSISYIMQAIIELDSGTDIDTVMELYEHSIRLDPYDWVACHNINAVMISRGYLKLAMRVNSDYWARDKTNFDMGIDALNDALSLRHKSRAEAILNELQEIEYKMATPVDRTSVYLQDLQELQQNDSKFEVNEEFVATAISEAIDFLNAKKYIVVSVEHDQHPEHSCLVTYLNIRSPSVEELVELNDELADVLISKDLFHNQLVLIVDRLKEESTDNAS